MTEWSPVVNRPPTRLSNIPGIHSEEWQSWDLHPGFFSFRSLAYNPYTVFLPSKLRETMNIESLPHCGHLISPISIRCPSISQPCCPAGRMSCFTLPLPDFPVWPGATTYWNAGGAGRVGDQLFMSNSICLMDLLKAPWVESVNLNGIL